MNQHSLQHQSSAARGFISPPPIPSVASGLPPIPNNPVLNDGTKKPFFANRFLLVVVILLGLALVTTSSILFLFKDKIFDKASYSNGVKTSFTIDLPNFEGNRYVEPVDDTKVLLVSVDKEFNTQAVYVDLPDVTDLPKIQNNQNQSRDNSESTKHKNSATLAPIPDSSSPNPSTDSDLASNTRANPNPSSDISSSTDPNQKAVIPATKVTALPKCKNHKSQHPYLIKDGKPACNDSKNKPKTVKVSEIKELPDSLKPLLDAELTVVGEIDGITIVHSDPKYSPFFVIGISGEQKFLWAKHLEDAIGASIAIHGHKLLVTTKNKIIVLEPGTKADVKKDNPELPADPKSLPNYQAYQEYLKLITHPVESDFTSTSREDIEYHYALVNIDKSGIPALLITKEYLPPLAQVPAQYGVMPYLYKADSGKIIKSKKHLLSDAAKDLEGMFRHDLYASKDGDGVIIHFWNPDNWQVFAFYSEKDGEIRATKKEKLSQNDNQPKWFNDKKMIVEWYEVSELEPLKKTLGIKENVINPDKKNDSDKGTDKSKDKDAIKKVDFENMTINATEPITVVQHMRKDCERNKNRTYLDAFPLQGGNCKIVLKNGEFYETYKSKDYSEPYESKITVNQKHYQDFNKDGYLDALVTYSTYNNNVQVMNSHMVTVWLTDPDNPTQPLGYSVGHPWSMENLKISDNGVSYTDSNGVGEIYLITIKISGSAKNPKIDITEKNN